jgi:hypothetical protein
MTMHMVSYAQNVSRRGMLRGRHMGTYPTRSGMRGFGQGFDFSQLLSPGGSSQNQGLTTAGNVIGAAVGVPGAGDIASGVVSTVQSIFGGNPATGANAQRQAHVYSIYETAMTAPGSAPSVDAVIELYAMATQQTDPITGVPENNPQATRTYAQQALLMLATQGWQNVNSFHPTFSGVAASGVVYGSDPTTGQAVIVGQRPIVRAGGMSLTTLLVVGGLAYVVFGRGARATATVHHTSSNPRRRHTRKRSRRRRATR